MSSVEQIGVEFGIPEDIVGVARPRLANYQEDSDDALHLRPHQAEAVAAYTEKGTQILDGIIPNQGMSIIHPTGSGKTATGTEITRLTCAGDGLEGSDLRALWLVPRIAIAQQTIGSEEQLGDINKYAPNLTVSEYSGRRKNLDGQVVVMPYQSLAGAIAKGVLKEIDPTLVVCDEAHHIIDGRWAKAIDSIRHDRLLLGLTATPDYSRKRNIGDLFPYVLATKSMRSGIEEGILANLKGNLYKGNAVINLISRGNGEDYNDEDVFNALIKSPDNLLAARLCRQEVAQGRRGVVSCARGHDRAHAKTMAKLLESIAVNAPGGKRYIRAAYVGSDLHEAEIDAIMAKYKTGELDVLTHVDYLSEGWDSPESDFMVLLRPTRSMVLAEQRIGRILRQRSGKIATVHEFVYDIIGGSGSQILHPDVIAHGDRRFGFSVKPRQQPPQKPSGRIYDVDEIEITSRDLSRIKRVKLEQLQSTEVTNNTDALPLDWITIEMACKKFDLSIEEGTALVVGIAAMGRVIAGRKRQTTYYPPNIQDAFVEHKGIERLGDHHITLQDIMRIQRESKVRTRLVAPRRIMQVLSDNGFLPVRVIDAQYNFVNAYNLNGRSVHSLLNIGDAGTGFGARERTTVTNDIQSVSNWLERILIVPEDCPEGLTPRDIGVAQSSLMQAIKKMGTMPFADLEKLQAKLDELEYEPNQQMKNVLRARNVTLPRLLAIAAHARNELYKQRFMATL